MAYKTPTALKKQEIDLLDFSLSEHNRMVKENQRSCSYEATIDLDEIRCIDIMDGLRKLGYVDKADFEFVRFKMEEYIDFLPDGISHCMGENSPKEQEQKVHAVLNRIRKLLGISKEEYKQGLYLGGREVYQ